MKEIGKIDTILDNFIYIETLRSWMIEIRNYKRISKSDQLQNHHKNKNNSTSM